MVEQLAALDSSSKVRGGIHYGESITNMPQGAVWTQFRKLLFAAEKAHEEYLNTIQYVKERLNPVQFWSQVAHAGSWVDLRLPKEGDSVNFEERVSDE